MLKFREILVPTDFSEASTVAFGLARELAEASGAKVVLVTVVDDPARLRLAVIDSPGAMLNLNLDALSADLQKHARERLRAFSDRLGPRCSDTVAVEGTSPAREIVRLGKERGSDLIVIATHGRTGVAHALMGSTAEKVVREAPCPVLTVRCSEVPEPRRPTRAGERER